MTSAIVILCQKLYKALEISMYLYYTNVSANVCKIVIALQYILHDTSCQYQQSEKDRRRCLYCSTLIIVYVLQFAVQKSQKLHSTSLYTVIGCANLVSVEDMTAMR